MKNLLSVIITIFLTFGFIGKVNAQTLTLGVGTSGSAAPIGLSDSVGIFAPESTAFGTPSGSQLGVTNQTAYTYAYFVRGTGDNTNVSSNSGQGSLYGIYHKSGYSTTHCEANNGLAVDDCLGAGRDGATVGLVANINDSTGLKSLEVSGTNTAFGNFDGVYTFFLVTVDVANHYWGAVRQQFDVGPNGTNAIAAPVRFDAAGWSPDMNGCGTTGGAGAQACGVFLGNLPGNSVGTSEIGAIFMAGKYYGCGSGSVTTITGIGAVTCGGKASYVPQEVIAKFVDLTTAKMKNWGANCANIDSARQPEVCLRFRSGNLLLNEGTATYGAGTLSIFKTGLNGGIDPGTVGPWEAGAGPGIAPTTPYLAFPAQGHGAAPAATSGSLAITTGNQLPAIGDAQIILAQSRSTVSTPTGLTYTCPTLWTMIQPAVDTAGKTAAAICYRIATDTNTSFTVSFTGSASTINTFRLVIFDYKSVTGFDSGANANKCATLGAATSMSGPSGMITTVNNAVVFTAFYRERADRTMTFGSARVRFRTWTPTGAFVAAMDKIQATAGAVTPETVTSISDSDGYATCAVTMY